MKTKVKFTNENMDTFKITDELDSIDAAKGLISLPFYSHWDRAFILNADTDEVIEEYKYLGCSPYSGNKQAFEAIDPEITFQASNLFLEENEEYKKLLNEAREMENKIRWLNYRCNHTQNNKYAIHVDKNGNAVCPLCGEVFNPDCVDKDYVLRAVDSIKNICNTIKMLAAFSDCEEFDIEKIADIMTFIDDLADMYEMVDHEFRKHAHPNLPKNNSDIFGDLFNNTPVNTNNRKK